VKHIDLKSYDALVFDFDGVIVDSNHIKADAFAKLFLQYGQDASNCARQVHNSIAGLSRSEKIEKIISAAGLGQKISENLETLVTRFGKLVKDNVIACQYIRGMPEYLKKVSRTHKCFVVSATPEHELREIIEARNLSSFFEGVFGTPTKKVQHFLNIAKKTGLSSAHILMFGDSMSDFEASQAVGLDFVGVNLNVGQFRIEDFSFAE
jgi:phosphoglycolate phosphatase-like HAD superfamily hydrolase